MTDDECNKLIEKYKRWLYEGRINFNEYCQLMNDVQYGVDLFCDADEEEGE